MIRFLISFILLFSYEAFSSGGGVSPGKAEALSFNTSEIIIPNSAYRRLKARLSVTETAPIPNNLGDATQIEGVIYRIDDSTRLIPSTIQAK